MNYGSLISEAFWLTWHNRFLWFFGFFVGSASFNFNFPTGADDSRSATGGPLPAWVGDPERWASNNLGIVLALASLVILVILIFIVLRLLSQGALVESVAALHRGEPRRFSSTWRAGVSHFWRVLGLTVLLLLLGLGLFLVVATPTALAILAVFAATDSVALRISLIILVALVAITLLILLVILLAIIGELALRELVVRGERIVHSIGAGYRLFRRNLGRSLLVWLIQAALLFGAGLVVALVLFILGLVLFVSVAALYAVGFTSGAIVAGVVAGLIFLVPFLIVGGALGTFCSSYWTLAYLRLADPAGGDAPRPEQGG